MKVKLLFDHTKKVVLQKKNTCQVLTYSNCYIQILQRKQNTESSKINAKMLGSFM